MVIGTDTSRQARPQEFEAIDALLTTPHPLQLTLIARPGDDVPERELSCREAFAGL